MLASGKMLVEAVMASWEVGDVDAVLSCYARDAVVTIHLPEVVPYAGVSQGRLPLRDCFQCFWSNLDVLQLRLSVLRSEDHNVLRSHSHFHVVHRATGLDVEGTVRHIWRISGDKIVKCDVFHDAPRLAAFFSTVQTMAPPTIHDRDRFFEPE